ncbi:hypothetical protein B1B05_13445 [Domibacillus enclensis]|uniref:Uncharacterized protein n=1 Tax=Domibacillus enclensis TaxID=1017273 RepID=A0ABX4E6R2_9BACI|nr:hypothetical protein B1B05_13445 [Domibacillus enclensis]
MTHRREAFKTLFNKAKGLVFIHKMNQSLFYLLKIGMPGDHKQKGTAETDIVLFFLAILMAEKKEMERRE